MCEGWLSGPHGASVPAGLPPGTALCSNHTTAPQLGETDAGSGHLYTVCVPLGLQPPAVAQARHSPQRPEPAWADFVPRGPSLLEPLPVTQAGVELRAAASSAWNKH